MDQCITIKNRDETKIVNHMLAISSTPSHGLKPDCRLKINDIRWIRIPSCLVKRISDEDEIIYINAYGNWWAMNKGFSGFKNKELDLLIRSII